MLSGMSTPAPRDAAGRRDPEVQRRLLALAQEASQYLRRHASPAVRLATALLLAASLAACNSSASDTTVIQPQTSTVAPLASEVASGLPRGPGTYLVDHGSVFRDRRGVYQFEWFDSGVTPGATGGHVGYASKLRLQKDDKLALEIVDAQDPVLHMPEAEPVGLIQEAQVNNFQAGPTYRPHSYSLWEPFVIGMLLSNNRPMYYEPPRTIVVDRDPDDRTLSSGGGSPMRVSGGSASETAKPPAQRVTGLQTAVSGRAGGTGSGSAVTARNATSGASSGTTSSSGSTASRSTSGTSASSGSSGVSAPRSGGFSSGSGSSGGSSAS